MKYIIPILLLIVSSYPLFAQPLTDIDSLEQELLAYKNSGQVKSAKLRSYVDIFAKYRYVDFKKAEKIGKMIIETAEALKKYDMLDLWYGEAAHFYAYYEIYSQALIYYTKGKNNALILKSDIEWRIIDIGNIYFAQKDYEQAEINYKEAIVSFKRKMLPNYKNPYRGLAVCYANLGLIHIERQQLDSALFMFHKSYVNRKQYKDPLDHQFICQLIANLHIQTASYDSAHFYVDKALAYNDKIEDTYRKVTSELYNIRANIYLAEKHYKKALGVLEKSILLADANNNINAQLQAQLKIVDLYIALNQHQKAINNGVIAIQLAKQLKNEYEMAKLQLKMAALYSKTENYEKAYSALKAYTTLEETIAEKNVNTLLNKFEVEQSEQRVSFLEKELTLSDKQKATYKTLVIVATLLSSALVILIALIIKGSKKAKKKSEKIDAQNKKINLQYHEINSKNKVLDKKNEMLLSTLGTLKQTQKTLVQSEKMASLGVLSAGIAHEINNPINFVYAGINSLTHDFEDIEHVISAFDKISPDSENLQKEIKQVHALKKEHSFDLAFEAIPDIINDIKIGAKRTAEIVKGLQAFSRNDQGELLELNVHEGLETSLILLKNKYKDRIEIKKNFCESLPLLWCLPGQINQVFMNILSNAIDAIENTGTITITTQKEESNIIITIKDTGGGISPEVQEKIFDPFYTTKAIGSGVGLGLSISFGIIKEHKGTIKIESEINKGTSFVISLPFGFR